MNYRTIIVSMPSGVVSTTFKILVDVIILYLTERILDYVEARVARRKLISNGKYTYSSRRLRLPIVGRLDIGGDAQIRTKRRTIILMLIFITTAILELNINGVSQRVTRPLTREEVGDNDIVFRPRKPLKDVDQITQRLRDDIVLENWKTITGKPAAIAEVESLAWEYVKRAVRSSDGVTYLSSMLCTLKFDERGSGRNESKQITWSLKDVKHINDKSDFKRKDLPNSVSGLPDDTVLSIGFNPTNFKSCDISDRFQVDGKTSNSNKIRILVGNDTGPCVQSSSFEDEWLCATILTNDDRKATEIVYYQIGNGEYELSATDSGAFMFDDEEASPSPVMHSKLSDDIRDGVDAADDEISAITKDKASLLSSKHSSCWEIGKRSSLYPIPLRTLQVIAGGQTPDDFLTLQFWYSALYATRNISGFEVFERDRQVTEINFIAVLVWSAALGITISYFILTTYVSTSKDKIGEKVHFNPEEAAHIARQWGSDVDVIGHNDSCTLLQPPKLIMKRDDPGILHMTVGGEPDEVGENDFIVGSA